MGLINARKIEHIKKNLKIISGLMRISARITDLETELTSLHSLTPLNTTKTLFYRTSLLFPSARLS